MTLRELAKKMLACPIPGHEDLTWADGIVRAMLRKALDGDVKAATWLRDTAGELPMQSVDITNSDRTLQPAMTMEERALRFEAMMDEIDRAERERDAQGAAA